MKFDLEKTQIVDRLLDTPQDQRNPEWRDSFLNNIIDASMASRNPQIIQGPDGFAYFVLDLPPSGESFTPFCVSHILDHCLNHGLGITVCPKDESAQWIFSYGSLLNLKMTGKFYDDTPKDSGEEVVKEDREVMVGQPDKSMFPDAARKTIQAFLLKWDFTQKRKPALFMLLDPTAQPVQSLVFNAYLSDFQSAADYETFQHLLNWHIPDYLGLVFIDENSELAEHFEEM